MPAPNLIVVPASSKVEEALNRIKAKWGLESERVIDELLVWFENQPLAEQKAILVRQREVGAPTFIEIPQDK
ncbi:MAG TPA: hypothetical protein VHD56_04580 [Tepidisphaeraceae bacterium]|nr:hypothetical protein [Tepidisphaeraceae bacterium]